MSLENLTYRGNWEEMSKMPNIAVHMGDEDLRVIGALCKSGFDADKAARREWETWYATAMKLALQVVEEKTFPWPGCSNVKFPLLTVAALNFHARAYPALLNGTEVVEYRPLGDDPDGEKLMRAKRVTAHQNYQLLQATDWEEHEDKALIVTPIMGCSFKKAYFDQGKGTVLSTLVLPQNLVVPYFTSSLESAPRVSELFTLLPNEFISRKRRGHYLDIDYSPDYQLTTDAISVAEQQAQRVTAVNPPDTDFIPTEFIEQHCWLDLDHDDYAEPYVVVFVRSTGQVCRIVARYSKQDVELRNGVVVSIRAEQYYIKKPFIPSPDGGFYDLGLGMLLGPLNAAADSLINQLIDAGTMHNLGGGFLGRGVKIRRGDNVFKPFEWKQIDTAGGSLRDNILELPVRTPSQALLDLLTFLVGYGERIAGSNEIQVGEIPGQNVKAETMQIANANGQKIFAAIYKRWWKASRHEFMRRYELTGLYISALGAEAMLAAAAFKITRGDYAMPASGIFPIADPNIASKEERQKTALMVLQSTLNVPGQNTYEAQMRVYRAFDVPNPDVIFPDPKGPNAIPPQPNAKLIDAQVKMGHLQLEQVTSKQQHQLAVAEMFRKVDESNAKINKLNGEADKARAEAKGVNTGHQIALIEAQIGAERARKDGILSALKLLHEVVKDDRQAGSTGSSGNSGSSGVSSVAAGPTNANVLSAPSNTGVSGPT